MSRRIIAVRAVIAGLIVGRAVEAEGQVLLPKGATLRDFFNRADRQMGFSRPRYFRQALRSPLPPVILINGAHPDPELGLKTVLLDGDTVSVMIPVGGG